MTICAYVELQPIIVTPSVREFPGICFEPISRPFGEGLDLFSSTSVHFSSKKYGVGDPGPARLQTSHGSSSISRKM